MLALIPLFTRGGVLVAVLAMSGCQPKASGSQCDRLIDRYAELVVKENFPDAGPDVIARERTREKTLAKADVLNNCPSQVQAAELSCAMQATTSEGIIKCLQ